MFIKTKERHSETRSAQCCVLLESCVFAVVEKQASNEPFSTFTGYVLSPTVLSLSYFGFARASLQGATEQLPALRKQV